LQELSLHVLDLAYNAVEAGARHVAIEVIEDRAADRLTVAVSDDGRGMDEATVRQVADPFYTSRKTRRVGLGLSLLKEAAEAAGGGMRIRSTPGRGTTVEATFQLSHVDRAPLGDLSGTVLVLIVGQPEVAFRYRHLVGGREFEFDGEAYRDTLGTLSPQHPAALRWLRSALSQDHGETGREGDAEAWQSGGAETAQGRGPANDTRP
jgi:anti-sigma regulatory factor (Ser/Thr protein kinase)